MDLLRQLSIDRKILAIAMSGYGMESDLEQTKRAGFNLHLVKPVSLNRLRDAIDQLVCLAVSTLAVAGMPRLRITGSPLRIAHSPRYIA